jgi:hypothetical protein
MHRFEQRFEQRFDQPFEQHFFERPNTLTQCFDGTRFAARFDATL